MIFCISVSKVNNRIILSAIKLFEPTLRETYKKEQLKYSIQREPFLLPLNQHRRQVTLIVEIGVFVQPRETSWNI